MSWLFIFSLRWTGQEPSWAPVRELRHPKGQRKGGGEHGNATVVIFHRQASIRELLPHLTPPVSPQRCLSSSSSSHHHHHHYHNHHQPPFPRRATADGWACLLQLSNWDAVVATLLFRWTRECCVRPLRKTHVPIHASMHISIVLSLWLQHACSNKQSNASGVCIKSPAESGIRSVANAITQSRNRQKMRLPCSPSVVIYSVRGAPFSFAVAVETMDRPIQRLPAALFCVRSRLKRHSALFPTTITCKASLLKYISTQMPPHRDVSVLIWTLRICRQASATEPAAQ